MVFCIKLPPKPGSEANLLFSNSTLSPGCRLDTTHTWVRCLVLETQTGVEVQTKAMVKEATTASIVEIRY